MTINKYKFTIENVAIGKTQRSTTASPGIGQQHHLRQQQHHHQQQYFCRHHHQQYHHQ